MEEQEEEFETLEPKYVIEGRDSIDTLELLKESTDVSLNNAEEENDDENFGDDDDEENGESTINEEETTDADEEENENKLDNSSAQDSQKNPLEIEYKKLDDEYFKNLKDDNEVETSDLNHLEPKLREAWIQMRRLDKKLALVTKKERQVKRETIALIEKNRAELQLLRLTSDHKESKLEAENTAHFLALSYVDLDDDLEKEINSNGSEILTPVFKTQLPDLNEESNESSRLSTPKNETVETKNNISSKSETASNFTKSSKTKSTTNTNKSKNTTTSTNSKNSKGQDKNFIQRNIKLAQDAGGTLAMTEEEKHRLNEILLDLDNLENDTNNASINQLNGENGTLLVEYNPMLVNLADGDGFKPNYDELEKLKRINTALEKRNYSRSSNSRVSGILSQSQFNNPHVIEPDVYYGLMGAESKQIKLNDDFDENEFGDKFIREARISREQEAKLKFLDSQLEKIKAINYGPDSASALDIRPESAISVVNEDQIKKLIDEYFNENSQNIIENGIREMQKLGTLVEENDNKINTEEENTLPKIDNNLIQKLLEEAKNEGLYQFVESNRTPSTNDTERAFYDEALELIKERENLWKNKKDLDQTVPVIENNQLYTKETTREVLSKSSLNSFNQFDNATPTNDFEENSKETVSAVSAKSSLNNSNQFINEEKYNRNILPPIGNKSDIEEFNRDDSRLSLMSSVSTNSSTVFPKIDSRYLPK